MELHRVAQGNEVKNKPTTLKHVPYNPPVTRALSKSGAMNSSAEDPKLLSAHSSAGHDEAETSLSRKRQNRLSEEARVAREAARVAHAQKKTEAKAESKEAREKAREEARVKREAARVAREAKRESDEAAEAERRKEAAAKKAEAKAARAARKAAEKEN
jgi:hypothetical protein